MSCSSDNPEQGTTIAKTRVTADGTYATESVFVSAAGSREDTKYVLESLSKTTKYEDEQLIIFAVCTLSCAY